MILFKSRVIAVFILFSGIVCSCKSPLLELGNNYSGKWQQSYMGGSGYITGVLIDPTNPEIVYARCDVAGLFKSSDAGKTWEPINNGMTDLHHHSVQSFAIHPQNPEILLRCSGDARANKIFGDIHKSIDGGKSWYKVNSEINFYGNGPSRMFGEVIVFHPAKPERVVAGGYSNGIWYSDDMGENWSFAGCEGERFTTVVFHSGAPDTIYAGTVSEMALGAKGERYGMKKPEDIKQFHDYVRGPGRLFRSKDGGKTWEKVFEGLDFAEITTDKNNKNVLYAATVLDGIHKSTDCGRSWRRIMNGLPDSLTWNTIASYQDEKEFVLFTAPDKRPRHRTLPPVPVYRSFDGGESWQLIKNHEQQDVLNLPTHKTLESSGWAIAKIRVHPRNSQNLFYCHWYGVVSSNNGGLTWDANNYKGTELVCAENIVSDPRDPNKLFFVLADHPPMVSRNGGKSYQAFSKGKFSNSTAIAVSKHRNGFVMYGNTALQFRGLHQSAIEITTDEGKSLETVWELPSGLFVQALRECPFTPGVFVAYLEGKINIGAGLYITNDYGKTWNKISTTLFNGVDELPTDAYWVDEELLPVSAYQVKNVCGTNHLLEMDPFRKDVIFFGDRKRGIFRSSDMGRTWENVGVALPFNNDRSSVLNVIYCDKNVKNRIYAGFIREGLWRSENAGQTWTKIFPTEPGIFNVSGFSTFEKSTLAVACEPLYWSKCNSSVWISLDEGANWKNVYDKSLGAIRWKSLTLQPGTGDLHAVSCGNGAFFLENITDL